MSIFPTFLHLFLFVCLVLQYLCYFIKNHRLSWDSSVFVFFFFSLAPLFHQCPVSWKYLFLVFVCLPHKCTVSSNFLFHKASFLFPKGPKVEYYYPKAMLYYFLVLQEKGHLSNKPLGWKPVACTRNDCFILNKSPKKENLVIIWPIDPFYNGKLGVVSSSTYETFSSTTDEDGGLF